MEADIKTDPSCGLRADAAHNRALVAVAAREVFAELGIDAPMIEVARRAGVGTATLYRRFPTRNDLIELVFEDRIEHCAATVKSFLSQVATEPWKAFEGYLRTLFALQIEDRAFTAVLLHSFPECSPLEKERQRALTGLDLIVTEAKLARALRQDFAVEDIELLLTAHEGVLKHCTSAGASSRITDLLLEACRPEVFDSLHN